MDKDKITPDLEQAVYELIRFFIKWGLWKNVFICCGGKVYTGIMPCESLDAYEEAFDLPGISKCEPQTGFRGLEDVTIFVERKERDALITLYYEDRACDLFWDGCLSANYHDMSEEAKLFLFENTWLGEAIFGILMDELPDDWVIDDYDSYEEWRRNVLDYYEPEEAVFPHEVRLDNEHIAAYDDPVEGIELNYPDFKQKASGYVIGEFYAILEKHGLTSNMQSAASQTISKRKNRDFFPLTKEKAHDLHNGRYA